MRTFYKWLNEMKVVDQLTAWALKNGSLSNDEVKHLLDKGFITTQDLQQYPKYSDLLQFGGLPAKKWEDTPFNYTNSSTNRGREWFEKLEHQIIVPILQKLWPTLPDDIKNKYKNPNGFFDEILKRLTGHMSQLNSDAFVPNDLRDVILHDILPNM